MTINHIAVLVSDIEKSREFYCKYFGAVSDEKYCSKTSGLQTYFLSFDNGARLEIMSRRDCVNNIDNNKIGSSEFITGLTHIAFSVGNKNNVDMLTLQLENDGYIIRSKPRITGDGYYESVVIDNEGIFIEITE